jgi:hypothetical protein
MTTTTTAAAALPADLEALLRQLRLPHARAIAADVLATARAQRWTRDDSLCSPLLCARSTPTRMRAPRDDMS